MARPLRIEFPGAIYHLAARGNARQAIFEDDHDRWRMCEGLSQTVDRCGWEVFAFVLMPNHLHLFLRTPRPNLSCGMQYLLSGYANWFSKRHQRPGHLFQGRFRGELVEDETYFWAVSRYIHLNPVRGRRPLVAHPRDWPWSSYPGYSNPSKRMPWVSYDILFAAWRGEMGGANAQVSYRRFVEAGLREPPESPFRTAAMGWLLGSQQFVARMRQQAKQPKHDDEVPTLRRLRCLEPATVLNAVAAYYEISVEDLCTRHGCYPAREVAAWLARRLTTSTLRELAPMFGLTHPDSVSGLTRRIEGKLAGSSRLQRDIAAIRESLADKTEKPGLTP